LRRWGGAALDFLYPPVCAICYRRLEAGDRTICFRCEGSMIVREGWRCPRCGALGTGNPPEPGRPCRFCPPDGAHYRGVFSVTGYFDASARCIHMYKYRRRHEMGEAMARMMRRHLSEPLGRLAGRLDRVAPVPLHWLRRAWRGFNQSDLLGRALSEELGVPCDMGLLERRRWTRRQALMPRDRRAANVAGAFAVIHGADLRGQGILVVDDVVTSGHTIGECARVLREAGAREVWGASFANTHLAGYNLADDLLQWGPPISAPAPDASGPA
jgi:ComF family protein